MSHYVTIYKYYFGETFIDVISARVNTQLYWFLLETLPYKSRVRSRRFRVQIPAGRLRHLQGFESIAGLVNDVAHFSHPRMFGDEGLLVWDEADESKFLLSHVYEAML